MIPIGRMNVSEFIRWTIHLISITLIVVLCPLRSNHQYAVRETSRQPSIHDHIEWTMNPISRQCPVEKYVCRPTNSCCIRHQQRLMVRICFDFGKTIASEAFFRRADVDDFLNFRSRFPASVCWVDVDAEAVICTTSNQHHRFQTRQRTGSRMLPVSKSFVPSAPEKASAVGHLGCSALSLSAGRVSLKRWRSWPGSKQTKGLLVICRISFYTRRFPLAQLK